MFLVYRPADEDEQRWEVKLGKLRTMECEAIEKRTGMDYGTTFKEKLLRGNALARRAFLWTMLRRSHPTLRFEDVDFSDDELELQLDKDEIAESREKIAAAEGLDETERAMMLAVLDEQLETAPEAPGKAQSSTSESATG